MNRLAPTLTAVIASLVLIIGAYMAANVGRSALMPLSHTQKMRIYRTEWEARAFTLATNLEGLFTGYSIYSLGPDDEVPEIDM